MQNCLHVEEEPGNPRNPRLERGIRKPLHRILHTSDRSLCNSAGSVPEVYGSKYVILSLDPREVDRAHNFFRSFFVEIVTGVSFSSFTENKCANLGKLLNATNCLIVHTFLSGRELVHFMNTTF